MAAFNKIVICVCSAVILYAVAIMSKPVSAAENGSFENTAVDNTALMPQKATEGIIAPAWQGLAQRLAADGLYGPQVDELLSKLGSAPTQAPMGRKISALYKRHFLSQPGKTKREAKYYKNVVNQANAELCRQYVAANRTAFEQAEQKYGVPPSIASSLLFVETRLGRILGDVSENAFYTLASMAVSDKIEDISQWLYKMPGYEKHLSWIDNTMRQRADWAYNEVRALVRHMLAEHIQPEHLPGSIYGAVGICQFMPSNLSTYGADGDGDGRVDLFNAADAIESMANYLARHGWKQGLSKARQHSLLMRYNNSAVYANTIMALAELVADPARTDPSEQKAIKRTRKS